MIRFECGNWTIDRLCEGTFCPYGSVTKHCRCVYQALILPPSLEFRIDFVVLNSAVQLSTASIDHVNSFAKGCSDASEGEWVRAN